MGRAQWSKILPATMGCSQGWRNAFIKHLIVQSSLYGDIYS